MRSLLISLLVACASSPGDAERPLPTEDDPVDAIETGSTTPQEALPSRPPLVIFGSHRVPVDVETAEDGLGNEVPAPAPIAIEIEAERWGGRALDPVLVIDGRSFRHYSHPGPGLIRYVLADATWLDEAQQMAIEYPCPRGCEDMRTEVPLPTQVEP